MHVVIMVWFLTTVNFFFGYTRLGITEYICNIFYGTSFIAYAYGNTLRYI